MTRIANAPSKQHADFRMNPVLTGYRERATPGNNWHDTLAFHATHALQRCKERYGFAITAQDWERLNWMIFRDMPGTEMKCVKNEDTTLYKVDFTPIRGRKRSFWVFFSERFFCVTTFVPAESHSNKHGVYCESPAYRERIRMRTRWSVERKGEEWDDRHERTSSVTRVLNAPPKPTTAEIRSKLLTSRSKEMERQAPTA